jgi:hypothetical protein
MLLVLWSMTALAMSEDRRERRREGGESQFKTNALERVRQEMRTTAAPGAANGRSNNAGHDRFSRCPIARIAAAPEHVTRLP